MTDLVQDLEAIARDKLNVPTIEILGTEELDMHRLHVVQIRRALLAAYMAGVQDAMKVDPDD